MFNFFKKKKIEPKTIIKKIFKKKEEIPINLDDLYKCSVQKQAFDFQIQTVDLSGTSVCVATDGMDCDLSVLKNAYGRDDNDLGTEKIFTYFAKENFIGFNTCSILCQDWLINKAVTVPCTDSIAIDYNITLKETDTDELDQDRMQEMKAFSHNRLKIKEICKKFAQNKRKFGQSLCIPLIEDVDYSKPFNIDAIKPKSYKGMVNVEPVWFNPVLDMRATTEPLSRRYYMPTWFKLANGSLIHHSWVIFNCYSEVSDILKPTYYFGGIPLPQLLYEQVYAAHRSAKEAPNLLQSKRLNYMSGAPLQALADDEEGIWDRAAYAFTKFRNNYGILVTQEDQQIGQIDTALTDVDSVTMLSYQIAAAICGVPSAKLLETGPKGWQSNGSWEDNNYKKLQLSIQTDDYIPILEMHYRLLHKSLYGEDKEFCIVFDPIDVPSEKERAEIREINARTDSTYIQAGVLSPEEVRGVLRQDENSGYDTLEEEMQGSEPDVFGEENGTESLNELVNDPTISASEAARK